MTAGILPLSPASADEPLYSFTENACTSEEVWKFSAQVPEAWRKKFQKPPTDLSTAVDVYGWAYMLSRAKPESELEVLGEYWMLRSLYGMKLVHLAHAGLNALVMRNPQSYSAAVTLAALDCLNVIQREYPSLRVSGDGMESVRKLALHYRASKPIMEAIYEIVGSHAKRNLDQVSWEMDILRGSRAHEAFTRTLLAVKKENDREVVDFSKMFLKQRKKPGQLEEHSDVMKLFLARALYNLKEYDAAIKVYESVPTVSNYFAEALQDKAWAHLMRRRYSEATSTAYNLLAGGVRRTFNPDAPLVMAISQFETCNYPDALKSVRYFSRQYIDSFQWLYRWKQNPKKLDLYQEVLSFLNARPGLNGRADVSKAPSKVGAEWIRSPVFMANQQEINLLLDEKEVIRQVYESLKPVITSSPKSTRREANLKLYKTVGKFARAIPEVQHRLVTQINRDLGLRNAEMFDVLKTALENAQLISVEVFDAAGQDIIVGNLMPQSKSKEPDSGGKIQALAHSGMLDWGRFPAKAGEEDQAEIWEDELGSLRTTVENNCHTSDVSKN